MSNFNFCIFLEIIGILTASMGAWTLLKKNGKESLFFSLFVVFVGIILLSIPLFSMFIFGTYWGVCNNSC